jgi:hypothetical protein
MKDGMTIRIDPCPYSAIITFAERPTDTEVLYVNPHIGLPRKVSEPVSSGSLAKGKAAKGETEPPIQERSLSCWTPLGSCNGMTKQSPR